MKVKNGVCVKTGAKVLVLEYGKVAAADLFLVNDVVIAKFAGSIHQGAWPDDMEATHELIVGLDGFMVDGAAGTIISVPKHQVAGEIIHRNGRREQLDLAKAAIESEEG